MTFLKRGCHVILVCALLASLLSIHAAAAETAEPETPKARVLDLGGEDMHAHIEETFDSVQSASGRRGFYHRCSTLVNWTTVVLGLQTEVYSCNGNGEYDLYEDLERTDCGYDVVRYDGSDYSLEGALNALSEYGTRDVYNIIIGWHSGYYGHTCFIHAILDGVVYFYESEGMTIAGTYYPSGEPIVCTIEEFAEYYDSWARFEGAVHFEVPDTGAPVLSDLRASDVSEAGFTLTFEASDDIEITDLYANVWTYGGRAKRYPVTLEDGIATVRVDTGDFDGFIGRYYAAAYASDRKDNRSSVVLEDCVNLYSSDSAEGTYRVLEDGTPVCNSPYSLVNGAATQVYTLEKGDEFVIVGSWVNDNGETWYLLEDGCWIDSASVRRAIQWSEVLAYLDSMFN